MKYLTQIKKKFINVSKGLVHISKKCRDMVCTSKIYKNIVAHFNINTISLIIAILAAYISYESLNESIKQRESMYKPVLFLGKVNYYVDIRDINHLRFYQIETDTVLKEVVTRPFYKLYNVGMGSALSVHGILTFNTNTLMDFFAANGLTDVKVVESSIPFTDVMVFKGDSIFSSGEKYIEDWTADYVLPINDSKELRIQYFPPELLETVVKAILWVSSVKSINDIGWFNIPIELRYKDINEKWLKMNFELIIRCLEDSENMVYCEMRIITPHDIYLKELYEAHKELH